MGYLWGYSIRYDRSVGRDIATGTTMDPRLDGDVLRAFIIIAHDHTVIIEDMIDQLLYRLSLL